MLKKILAVALLIVAAIAIAQGPPINRPPIVDQGNVTITGGTITGLSSPLPVASGGTNAASASITAFNNITGYTASGATGTTSTNLVFSTSPTFVTPVLGAATATSINGNTITTGTGTLTIVTGGQTLCFKSGTFTPVFNTFTLIGGDTSTATYVRIGNVVRIEVRAIFGTSSASTAGTSNITGHPYNISRYSADLHAGSVSGTVGFAGPGIFNAGSPGQIYPTTWAATASVVVSGTYETTDACT